MNVFGRLMPIFACVSIVGCDAVTKNTSRTLGNETIQTLGTQIVGFNWSNSSASIDVILQAATSNAQSLNQKIKSVTDIPNNGIAGYGLYMGSDPLQSSSYGTELSCIVLKPSATWKDFSYGFSVTAISGPESVLRYIFAPGILPLPSPPGSFYEFAAVVRNDSAVDLSRSKKISFQREGLGEELSQRSLAAAQRALSEKDICAAVAAFEGEFSILVHALNAASSGAFWSGTRFAPLLRMTLGSDLKPSIGNKAHEIAAAIRARPLLLAKLKETEPLSKEQNDVEVTSAFAKLVFNIVGESDDLKGSPQDWQKELLSSSGLIQIRSESKSWRDLRQDIIQSINDRYQDWGRAHPVETQIMRDWLQQLEQVRLATLK